MNTESIKAAFQDWWRESYGMPPGTHAVMTHVAFTEYVLQLLELSKNAPATRPTTDDICRLGMPKELLFPLLRAGIDKISQASRLSEDDLQQVKRIGPDRAQQIREYLSVMGDD